MRKAIGLVTPEYNRILRVKFENLKRFEDGIVIPFSTVEQVNGAYGLYRYYRFHYVNKTLMIIGHESLMMKKIFQLFKLATDIVFEHKDIDEVEIPKELIQDGTLMTVDYFDGTNQFFRQYQLIFAVDKSEEYGVKDEISFSKFDKQTQQKKLIYRYDNLDDIKVNKHTRGSLINTHKLVYRKEINYLKTQVLLPKNLFQNKNGKSYQIVSLFDDFKDFDCIDFNEFAEDVKLLIHDIENIQKSDNVISLKMYNADQVTCGFDSLNHYISTEIVNGAILLSYARSVLATGGYLLIDHISTPISIKSIQIALSLFKDDISNQNGACMLLASSNITTATLQTRKDSVLLLLQENDKCMLKSYSEILPINLKYQPIRERIITGFIEGSNG